MEGQYFYLSVHMGSSSTVKPGKSLNDAFGAMLYPKQNKKQKSVRLCQVESVYNMFPTYIQPQTLISWMK